MYLVYSNDMSYKSYITSFRILYFFIRILLFCFWKNIVFPFYFIILFVPWNTIGNQGGGGNKTLVGSSSRNCFRFSPDDIATSISQQHQRRVQKENKNAVAYYEWWTIRNSRTTSHTCYVGGTNEEKNWNYKPTLPKHVLLKYFKKKWNNVVEQQVSTNILQCMYK